MAGGLNSILGRGLVLALPAVHLALFQAYLARPRWLYVVLVAVMLTLFFALRQFIVLGRRREGWLAHFILPATLALSASAFSTVAHPRWLNHFVFALYVVFLYLHLKTTYNYLARPDRYRADSLENLSSYVNFLNYFFAASAVYGFQVFLGFPTWSLMLCLLAFTCLVAYQVYWSNGIRRPERYLFILINGLVLVQIAWAATFLTLNYYILGLILSVCYYILIGLTRFYLKDVINARIVKAYLLLGLSSILAVLLSANWFSYG